MAHPTLWGLRNLVDYVNKGETKAYFEDFGFVPARPEGFASLRDRFRIAWLVFKGDADAVIWPHQ